MERILPQRLEKAKSQKYKKLSKVESLNYRRSEHEIKKTSLINWSVSLEMLNRSIVSFRLLYLKTCQNWAQATLYKVYACFWVYMLFLKTRDSGGFMCHVTGIYYLGYPRGSGNSSWDWHYDDIEEVIKLIGIPTPGLVIYSVEISFSWSVNVSLMIIIDKYLYLSNTIIPQTYYHVLHLKYTEIEPIVMTRKLFQKSAS